VASTLVLLFLLAIGRLQEGLEPSPPNSIIQDVRIGIWGIAVVVYLATAQEYVVRGARELVGALAASGSIAAPDAAPLAERAGVFPRRTLFVVGLAGVAFLAAAQLQIDRDPIVAYGFWSWAPEGWTIRLAVIAIGWLSFRFLYTTLTQAVRMARIARESISIDLFDPAAIEPITRQGLRLALLTMGFFSLFALLLADLDAAPGLLGAVSLGMGIALGVAAIVFIMPIRELRRRIVAVKHEELAKCHREIALARARMNEGEESRMADHAAYCNLIEGVHEWPVDLPTLTRFALYLLLPLFSWVGGALVERLVNTVIEGR
jgi:hypothetical protein